MYVCVYIYIYIYIISHIQQPCGALNMFHTGGSVVGVGVAILVLTGASPVSDIIML